MSIVLPKYQSITIQPGQSVYLPSNANVIAINSTGDAQISSECIDTTVEESKCYVFVTSITNASGGHTEPYQSNNVTHLGIVSNGQEYLFSEPITWSQNSTLPEEIQNLPGIGALFFSVSIGTQDDGDYGTRLYIVFKTTPTIAAGLMLKEVTTLFWDGEITQEYYIKADIYSEIVSEASDPLPECTESSVLA